MKECKWTKLPNGGLIYENAYGAKFWHLDNNLHREDGPAVECYNGDKIWYLNDKRINCTSQKEFERLMRLKAFW